ncbi:enamine deaminase RidA (YjgF/YER057c/UK114 family) [Rhodococcus wratislaviensis]|uniref:Transcriptional regulator n=1 Tax=Rhodococcus wratislaviensis TaxID=44752 RepID=A0AB38FKF4_RHOWR|nr:RidA family protein [Rhodococcus wratislaviensis]REE74492.1 enamine deaminase RidA (YjgF/YER057c/UK114 family) [Rhodococcus wratislaviensis]SPZ41971.1 transcriptional regulator [Rhodococcus wratislaviensis]
MGAESRLRDLGLVLPHAVQLPPGMELPFSWVRVHGRRVLVSGHGPLAEDGTPAGPFGSVPADVSAADATHSARLTALAVLAGVRRAVGDLDRIGAWLTVTGFVNAEPGYDRTTAVLNGFSELVLDVFGPDVGDHARTAIGVAALPLNLPVVVAAELELA